MKSHGENLVKKIVTKKEMVLVKDLEDLENNHLHFHLEKMAKDHHFGPVKVTTMTMVSEFLFPLSKHSHCGRSG